MKKNIAVIYGGTGEEHEISLISAEYVFDQLKDFDWNIFPIKIEKNGVWTVQGSQAAMTTAGQLISGGETISIDLAVSVCHGHPGETGHLPAFFEMCKVPFIGASLESSVHCFNKISTKMWLEKRGIPTTPSTVVHTLDEKSLSECENFFDQFGDIFIKASNQGSSVGCFHVTQRSQVKESIAKALQLSDYCLIEKTIKGRELEVSVWKLGAEIKTSWPGEIICSSQFYSYEEKYSDDSQTQTTVKANIDESVAKKIQEYSRQCFEWLNLKDFVRIDFFLAENGEILVNEINTTPGLTPISMFPQMLEQTGQSFKKLLGHLISEKLD